VATYAQEVKFKGTADNRESVKAGKSVGVIHDYTVTGFEQSLSDYK
jgi:hypothetical protein